MNSALTHDAAPSLRRQMLNKVPEVTLYFWVIKILCTTVGETASDYLAGNLSLGLTKTTLITGSVLIVALVFQFRLRRYVPAVYWLSVVLISVVGTQITDNLTDNLGVSLVTTTIVFSIVLAIVFAAWYASERTLSIHTIYTTRREAFYWLAVLFTFALGTAAGDLTAERLNVGYAWSVAPLRRRDRPRGRCALPLQPERRRRLLDRLHPDPSARRVARRLPVAAPGRRRPRPRHDRDERDLPRRDSARRRLPERDAEGCDRGRTPRAGGAGARRRAPHGRHARAARSDPGTAHEAPRASTCSSRIRRRTRS